MSKIATKLRDRANKMNPISHAYLASDLLDAADEIEAAEKAIRDAPHSPNCRQWHLIKPEDAYIACERNFPCNCWKRYALEKIDGE